LNLANLEKNLQDLNNGDIPKEVLDIFWEMKQKWGSSPMGVSRIDETYFIVCPASENYILWSGKAADLLRIKFQKLLDRRCEDCAHFDPKVKSDAYSSEYCIDCKPDNFVLKETL